jgi:ParB family transcriptional regulator, chromosome partitioning protein
VLHIPLGQLEPNPYQTRQHVDEHYLQELADSIVANGVLQPVIVRPARDGRFTLIAGECRWRASKLAGKATIPAIVREVSNQQALEMTIIENLQRQDLNCWEQAQAFGRLAKEFQLTQEEIAKRTGLERSSVANYLRLLKLPQEVQELLRDGKLEFGQAKVLMSVGDPHDLVAYARQAANLGMSVRELQDWIERSENPRERPDPKRKDPNVLAAQSQLERALGVRVRISDRNGKGHITIEYKSIEDFERVVEALGK